MTTATKKAKTDRRPKATAEALAAPAPKRIKVGGRGVPATPQRRRHVEATDIRLEPGQYLIRTPEIVTTQVDRQGRERSVRQPYNGEAYKVMFRDNIAVIDDTSVAEIREEVLREVQGDEGRVPSWYDNAEALARKLQSDFGYEVIPTLRKLPKISNSEFRRMMPRGDGQGGQMSSELASQMNTVGHSAPTSGRKLHGIDPDAEVTEPEPPAGIEA